ncbi:hypothetical protein E2C01_019294 [Portunus trituberculatus]|uniref:Secreted protein n=1 Tax=Portunus trituberculatus TaxID=210409 RepID=A0A5B7DWU9_PORTR|nr:hypothetical protein [Portunus trituberculatus]
MKVTMVARMLMLGVTVELTACSSAPIRCFFSSSCRIPASTHSIYLFIFIFHNLLSHKTIHPNPQQSDIGQNVNIVTDTDAICNDPAEDIITSAI